MKIKWFVGLLVLVLIASISANNLETHVEEYSLHYLDTSEIKPGIDFLNALPDSIKKIWKDLRTQPTYDIEEISRMAENIRLDTIISQSNNGCRYKLIVEKEQIDTCVQRITKWESDGKNFLLGFDKRIIHNTQIFDWNRREHGFVYPSLLNGKILAIEIVKNKGKCCNEGIEYAVAYDGNIIFNFDVIECVDHQIKAFFTHDSNWYLQVGNVLYKDGKNINDIRKHKEIFNSRIFLKKLFYIAEKEGKYRIYLNNKSIGDIYDYVFHDKCCEPAVMNIINKNDYIGVFGMKNGIWYLTVISSGKKKK